MTRKTPLMFGLGLTIALGSAFVATGCNDLTGAKRIVLYEDDGSSSNTNSGAGAGDPTTSGDPVTTNGSGSATHQAASTGAGPATQASTGAGPATQQASSSSTGGDPCVYPAGPYGVAQGNTMPPNLSWQVYAPGSNTPSTVTTAELFDCDGSKGTDVLVFDTSQYG